MFFLRDVLTHDVIVRKIKYDEVTWQYIFLNNVSKDQ